MPRRAVIDIGTNSVKLLLADCSAGAAQPVLECSEQTRLGRGFYEDRRLQARPIAHTARVVAEFARRAAEHGARLPRVVATSAVRDATNREALLEAIRAATDLRVEVVSGEQEGDWAFRGVASESRFAGASLLILDVGGGSTEFSVGGGGKLEFCQSFPLGSVRLLEALRPADPPGPHECGRCLEAVRAFLRSRAAPVLSPSLANRPRTAMRLIGTGGTASILGAMELGLTEFDRARLEGARLSRGQVERHLERLWGLPLKERRRIPGLPPERADVILTGVGIYQAVMEEFGWAEVSISTRGMRFGAILDPAYSWESSGG
jgi:exopolyphosphatase/guanosine-5'-triphosphate,3'-diphosphate pyrophosphatase